MNHEQQPPRQEPDRRDDDHPKWDPDERVGDIYEVELGAEGVERIDQLTAWTSYNEAPRDHETEASTPRIWVGSLADYNNGILHGAWIDAAREADDVHADIEAMLARSPWAARSGEPAEEWGIFDYEGFGQASIYQHDDIAVVSRVARGITEHGLAFAAWASVVEGDEQALDAFGDNYLGHYDSLEAYAEQLVDDLGYDRLIDEAVPSHVRPYVRIDTAALARDLALSGDLHILRADDGGVWIFDAR